MYKNTRDIVKRIILYSRNLYKTGANLYDRDRFAPVLFHFIFTGLLAVRREVR